MLLSYKFEMNIHGESKVTYKGSKEVLDEILEDFKDFLRGCGYSTELVNSIKLTEE